MVAGRPSPGGSGGHSGEHPKVPQHVLQLAPPTSQPALADAWSRHLSVRHICQFVDPPTFDVGIHVASEGLRDLRAGVGRAGPQPGPASMAPCHVVCSPCVRACVHVCPRTRARDRASHHGTSHRVCLRGVAAPTPSPMASIYL